MKNCDTRRCYFVVILTYRGSENDWRFPDDRIKSIVVDERCFTAIIWTTLEPNYFR